MAFTGTLAAFEASVTAPHADATLPTVDATAPTADALNIGDTAAFAGAVVGIPSYLVSSSRAGLGSIVVTRGASTQAYLISNVGVMSTQLVLGVAQMDGAASVVARSIAAVQATAQMDGRAQVAALSVLPASGVVQMDGQAQVQVGSITTFVGGARMDGLAQVAATSVGIAVGAARMDGQAQVVAISVSGASVAQMNGAASMAAVGPNIYKVNMLQNLVGGAATSALLRYKLAVLERIIGGEATKTTSGYSVIARDTINLIAAPVCHGRFTERLMETTIVVTPSPQPHTQFRYVVTTPINVRPQLTPAWAAITHLVQNLLVSQTTSQKFIWGRQLIQALKISATLAAGGRYQKLLTQLLKLSEVEGFKLRHPVALSQNIDVSLSLASAIGLKLLQKFQITTTTSLKFDYHLTLASKVVLGGLLEHLVSALLEQLFTVHPAINRQFVANSLLAQLLTVHPALGNKLVLKLVGNLQLSPDQLVSMLYAGDSLLDGVTITALYISPSGTTTTWAVNTRTAAVTEYLNYDFQSFASMGNRYIAAGPGGLYELDGATDAGALIISDMMSGYLQLNEKKLFGIKGAYVAIRGGGRFYLKLIAGDGREYVYELKAQPNLMTTKIKVGKGIKTTYMAFELVTEGQDFDLDSVEFIPMTSGRRV